MLKLRPTQQQPTPLHLNFRCLKVVNLFRGKPYSWFLNLQKADGWGESAIAAAPTAPSTTTRAAAGSIARQLHAEQS